jgi:hypothetical protein
MVPRVSIARSPSTPNFWIPILSFPSFTRLNMPPYAKSPTKSMARKLSHSAMSSGWLRRALSCVDSWSNRACKRGEYDLIALGVNAGSQMRRRRLCSAGSRIVMSSEQ